MAIIFVTGCARSGTSLTTGILQACGANLGRVNNLNEIARVREGVIKPYLRNLGLDPLGQYPLADPHNLKPYPNFRKDVLNAMDGAQFYKCAKAGPLWTLFHEHFPEAKWVIVRRPTDDIVDSCKRTTFMQKHPNWKEWVHYHLQCFDEMKENLDCFEVWPKEGIHNPDYFKPLIRWLGLEWNPEAVQRTIKPKLYHAA